VGGSYNKGYEIEEFDGVPGQTYKKIIRFIPGDDRTWYGLPDANATSTSGSRSFYSLTITTGSSLMWDYGT
jgi:hypothetical protein